MRTSSISWWAGLFLLVGTLTAAEAAGPLTQIGPWLSLGSSAHDLVIKDTLAYVVTDVGLRIVDIANPAAPVGRGAVKLGGKSYGVALQWPYVFTVNIATGFQVVDVSNPDAPLVVATLAVRRSAWDVAVKDDVAYVASMGGQLVLIDIADPRRPRVLGSLGLPAWKAPGSDAPNIKKLNAYVTTGNAKDTGVAVVGPWLFTLDWGYGRFYAYDVTDARRPRFAGTHHAPYLLRVEIGPEEATAYALSAFGSTSGVYSVPLARLNPMISTSHATCADCGYFASPTTDFGGLAVSANGRYVMYIAGKRGVVQVLDVTDPTRMRDAGSVPIPTHYARLAQSMGIAQFGNHIIAAGAELGLGVFQFPGLSD